MQFAAVVQTGFVPVGHVAAHVDAPPPPPQHDSPVPHWAVVEQILFEPAGHVAPVWQVFGVPAPPPASAPAAQHELPVAQSPVFAQICVVPAAHDAAQAATPPAVAAVQHTWPAVVHDAVPRQGAGARHVMMPRFPPKKGAAHVEPVGQSAFVAQTWVMPIPQVAAQDVRLTFPASPPPPPPPPPKQHCSPAPQLAEPVQATTAAPAGHALAEAAHEVVGAAPPPPSVTQQTWDAPQLHPAPASPPPATVVDVALVVPPADVLPAEDPLLFRELEVLGPGPLFVVPPPQATATATEIPTATTARAFFKYMGRPSGVTTSASPVLDGELPTIASTFLWLGSSLRPTPTAILRFRGNFADRVPSRRRLPNDDRTAYGARWDASGDGSSGAAQLVKARVLRRSSSLLRVAASYRAPVRGHHRGASRRRRDAVSVVRIPAGQVTGACRRYGAASQPSVDPASGPSFPFSHSALLAYIACDTDPDAPKSIE